MKLPDVQYRRVESMGRHDLGALSAVAQAESQKGKAIQNTFNKMAVVAADYIQREEDHQFDTAVAETAIELAEWHSENDAKQFYSPEELGDIPQDLVPRTITSTNNDGSIQTGPREDIPADEVYPLLLKQKMDGLTAEKAAKIRNKSLRKAYTDRAEIDTADRVMKATVAAERVQQERIFTEYTTKAQEAAAAGRIDVAKFFIDKLEAEDSVKAEILKKLQPVAEGYFVTQAIRSEDLNTIAAMRGVLDNPDYSGYLTENQRQAAIKDLDDRDTYLNLERVAALKQAKAENFDSLAVGIMDGQVTRQQIENAYTLGKADEDDPNGLTPPQHTQLMRAYLAGQESDKKAVSYDAIIAGWKDGSVPGDATNKDHRDAMEYLVQTIELTPDNVAELGILTADVGIMPEMLQTKINGFILQGSPEQQTMGLTYFMNLQNEGSHLVSKLDPRAQEVAGLAKQLYEAQMEPAEAIAKAREYQDEIGSDPAKRTFYKDQWRENDYDIEGDLQTLMNNDAHFTEPGWFGTGIQNTTSTPSDPMRQKFRALTELYYPLTKGSKGQAEKMAYDAVKAEFGPTQIGVNRVSGETGQHVSRYPMEQVTGLDPKHLNMGLKAFAEEQGLEAGNIAVIADDSTLETNEWKVIQINEDMSIKISDKNFNPWDYVKDAAEKDWTDRMNQNAIAKRRSRARGGARGGPGPAQ